MEIQGTVTSIVPTTEVGYQSQNGYIYTFNMGVQTLQGAVYGEIGSKSQNYPIAIGQPIIVDSYKDEQGRDKFKKINPKYAGQNQQQAPSQGQQQQPPPPQAQQNAQQPAQPTYTPERDTGLSIERQACCKAAAHRFQGISDIAPNEVLNLANLMAHFVATGKTYFSGNEDNFLDRPASDDDIPV